MDDVGTTAHKDGYGIFARTLKSSYFGSKNSPLRTHAAAIALILKDF